MSDDREPTNLEQLLDRLSEAGEGCERVSLGTMLDAAGRRSFGPLLLVLGLIALSPLSGVPGIPTTLAVMVLLIAGQLLLGRTHFWLPCSDFGAISAPLSSDLSNHIWRAAPDSQSANHMHAGLIR